jgi:putative oxidoreductase
MLMRLLATDRSIGMLWVRIPLGIFMVHHGYEKFLHPTAFIAFCDNLGIPPFLAVLALSSEFLGGLGIIVGGLTRIAAFGVGTTMFVAAMVRHVLPGYGMIMNYHATLRYGTEGFEIHTLAVGMSLGLMVLGAGSFSIDYALHKLLSRRQVGTGEALGLHGSPAPIA